MRTMSKDGTAIAFDRSGTGPPVILVDGALCSRAFGPMPKLAPLLAEHFTVFTYDRRGRHDSGDTAPYAVEREIEDLDALIGEAGGSASVLGMSSGAALALRAAASGLDIRRLALFEPPYTAVAGGQRPPVDHHAQLTCLIAEGLRGDAVTYFMTKMVGMPAIVAFVMRLTPIWPKLKAVAHTLPYDAAIMGEFLPPVAEARAVAIPTLVIGGGKSPASLRQAVQAIADALPNARRRTLEGQTHNVSPKVLAPVLVEFFAPSGSDGRESQAFGYLPSTTS